VSTESSEAHFIVCTEIFDKACKFVITLSIFFMFIVLSDLASAL